MEKFILLQTNGEFFVIVHAAPGKIGRFQWYWMDDPNEGSEYDINGQIYESIALSSNGINEHYRGKWLACHCDVDGEHYDEGCVYLTDDFIEMIRSNQFDTIDFFDHCGNIRKDIGYTRGDKLFPKRRSSLCATIVCHRDHPPHKDDLLDTQF